MVYCSGHYTRWRKYGSPGDAELRTKRSGCQVDGCDRKHFGQGFCQTHRYRWVTNGDPLVTRKEVPRYLDEHPLWGGDDVGYQAAHRRLRKHRGRASSHDCEACGSQAIDWAYLNIGGVDERVGSSGGPNSLRYTTNLDDYVPMCRSCHRTFDKSGLSFLDWLRRQEGLDAYNAG